MQNIILYSVQPVLAAGFGTLLGRDFVLSTVVSDTEALRHRVQAVQPKLVVIELTPSITLERLRWIRVVAPHSGIILWTDAISTEFASQAMSLGIRGILRRGLSAEMHIQCLREVAAGALWVEKELSQNLLTAHEIQLTPREQQLMGLLAQGLKNKEIAWSLGITEGTVKVYLSRLFDKVGANDRFELALLALKNLAPYQSGASGQTPKLQGDRAVPFLIPSFVSTARMPAAVGPV